ATALVTRFGLLEDLIGLEVHESPPHRAMAENTLEMPDPAASAKPLLRVERNDTVAGLPHAIQVWIEAEPDAYPKRPDTGDLAQFAAGSCDTGRHCVGVVQNKNRAGWKGH